MEKIADTILKKNETVPQPPADFLDNDPRYKELLQEASKDSIRSDTSGYMGRQGYSWNEKGGIVDKEGHDVFPSQLVGPAQIEGVTDAARQEFSERYGTDAGIYTEREKTRIYSAPELDPSYGEVVKEINKKANSDRQSMSEQRPNLGRDDYERLANRNEVLASEAFWGSFVSEYPEKASAYASKNEYITKAIAEEEKRKQYWEGVEKKKQNEIDEARIKEIRRSLNGEPALKQGASVDTSGIGEPVATDSRWDEFRGNDNKSIARDGEDIYRNFWSDDPELKAVQENIKTETAQRLAADKTMHENFGDHYSEVANTVRNEQWRAFVAKYPEKAKSYQEYYKEIRDILNPPEPMKPEVVSEIPTVVEARAESPIVEKTVEVEKPKKVEESLSQEDIVSKYLAYQDMDVSVDKKRSMVEYVMNPEKSGLKYAGALQEILASNQKEQVEGTAVHMVAEAKDILKKLGVSGSPYLGSKTWAMWDIGKQYYYFTHPDEADKKYTIADPFKSPEKITEIIDRHVGWEAYRIKDRKFAEKFSKHPLYRKLQELLSKPPKSTDGDLSSKDLAELGSVIREITK